MGFRDSVSLLPAILATEPLALAPVGLLPTERADLRWTHSAELAAPLFPAPRLNRLTDLKVIRLPQVATDSFSQGDYVSRSTTWTSSLSGTEFLRDELLQLH